MTAASGQLPPSALSGRAEKPAQMNDIDATFSERPVNLATVSEAIEEIRAGRFVIVMDDENRENEGDLVMAARFATAERVAFAVRHTTGILCAPMTSARAVELNLPPMVAENKDSKGTAFTVTTDAVGTGTGVCASDRAKTFRQLACDSASAADFNRPGHIFPLVSREGGILERQGHTEAATELCQMAEIYPAVGLIGELINDDGTMMRLDDCVSFARRQGLKVISVEQLVAARRASPVSSVNRTAPANVAFAKPQPALTMPPPPAYSEFTTDDESSASDLDIKSTPKLKVPASEICASLRIGIVRTSWNTALVKPFASAIRKHLMEKGVVGDNVNECVVPGAFELPWMAQQMASHCDAVICVGLLLKGETLHFEVLSHSTCQGLMDIQLRTGVPMVNGVLNCFSEEQAAKRCDPLASVLCESLAATAVHMAALRVKVSENK